MKRLLSAFILLCASLFGQQIYPHHPESGTQEGPTLRVHASPTPPSTYYPVNGSKSLDIHLRALSWLDSWLFVPPLPGTGGGSFIPIYKGDFVGHFWVIIDFSPGTTAPPPETEIPNLYQNTYAFDWDLVLNEELHLPTPVQPPLGPYWYNFWFSQTLTGTVLPSRNLFPSNAASEAFDVSQGGYADIPIARFVYPTALQGTWVQIHVIGNMWHEVDGQGWIYMNIWRLL